MTSKPGGPGDTPRWGTAGWGIGFAFESIGQGLTDHGKWSQPFGHNIPDEAGSGGKGPGTATWSPGFGHHLDSRVKRAGRGSTEGMGLVQGVEPDRQDTDHPGRYLDSLGPAQNEQITVCSDNIQFHRNRIASITV